MAGVHGLGEQLEDPLRGVRGRLALGDVLEQHGELVAAEARRDVGAADAVVEPARELDEHLVAGGVAERVVDGLEVVEVEEDHRRRARLAPGARDRLADLLGEHRAVRESGHGVVERLVGELGLERLALADVAGVEQDAADVLVVDEVREQDLELAGVAVAAAERAFERLDAVPGGVGGDAARKPIAVAGRRQAVERVGRRDPRAS